MKSEKMNRTNALQSNKSYWLMIIPIFLIVFLSSVSAWTNNTFNNSLQQENLSLTSGINITRYLAVPSNVGYLTIGSLNFTYPFATNTVTNVVAHGLLFDSVANGVYLKRGFKIHVKSDSLDVYNMTKNATVTATKCYILNSSGTILASSSFVSNLCTFSPTYRLTSNTKYYVGLDSNGSAYNLNYISSGLPVVSSYFNWTTGYGGDSVGSAPGEDSLASNIISVGVANSSISGAGIGSNISISIGGVNLFSDIANSSSPNITTILNVSSFVNSYLSGCTLTGSYCNVPFIFNSLTGNLDVSYSYLNFSNVGITENSQTFNASTVVGTNEPFTINVTYDSTYYPSSTATLTYNNLNYTGTKVGSGNTVVFNSNLTIPSISGGQQNNTFYWTIGLTNSSGTFNYQSTSHNQSVITISIDDCSSNTIKIYNFTMYDEDTLNFINASLSNTTVQLSLSLYSTTGVLVVNYSNNFTKINPVLICMKTGILNTSSYKADITLKYDADPYVSKFYNEQKTSITNTNVPKLVPLYDLLQSEATEFKLTFKDASLLPLSDYLVQINKRYLSDNSYKTVEIGKTDGDGISLGQFVLSSAYYKLTVTKDGNIITTYPEFQAFCPTALAGNCIINKFIFTSSPENTKFYQLSGIRYTAFTFNSTTRVVSTTFTVVDGSSQNIILNATDVTGLQVTSTSLSSSSGTLSITLPIQNTIKNQTYFVYLQKDNEKLAQRNFDFNPSPSDRYGNSTGLIVAGIVITMVMMTLSSGGLMIFMFILGLVFSSSFGLLSVWGALGIGVGTGILGSITALVLFVILFMFKLNRSATPQQD